MTWLMQSFRYFSRFADKQVLTIVCSPLVCVSLSECAF